MSKQYIKIPLLGRISAKISLGETISGAPSTITLSKDTLQPECNYYALVINGDSMKHTYKNGEVVLVNDTQDIKKNDVIVARTQQGDTIKRVLSMTKNKIDLISDNNEIVSFAHNKIDVLGVVVDKVDITTQQSVTLVTKNIVEHKPFNKNTIVHGDALIEMRKIANNSVDVVIADPPYNIGKDFGNNIDNKNIEEYIEWCNAWMNESLRCLKQDGTMFVYGFSEILSLLVPNINANKRWLVWHYTNKNVASLNFWQRSHESILCIWKNKKPTFFRDAIREPYSETFLKNSAGKVRKSKPCRFSKGESTTIYNAHSNGALPRDVIKIPALAGGAGRRERHFLCKNCNKVYVSDALEQHRLHNILKHPTQKPRALTQKLLNSCLNKRGTVLIPFAGSGSECYVAKKLGYDFIGIELNKEYIDLANGLLDSAI